LVTKLAFAEKVARWVYPEATQAREALGMTVGGGEIMGEIYGVEQHLHPPLALAMRRRGGRVQQRMAWWEKHSDVVLCGSVVLLRAGRGDLQQRGQSSKQA
jgi:hypothetical protein